MRSLTMIMLVLSVFSISCRNTQPKDENNVNLNIDLSNREDTMKPVWAWFGYDEPNYTYMKDGKKLLS